MTMKYGIKDLAVGRSDTYRIEPRELHVKEGWNSRVNNFDPTDADDLALAHSIAENGVKQPITVFWEDGKPIISDGHRRHGATLYAMDVLGAEVKSVPVQTEDRYSSEADRVFSQIVRNSGKPLAPIEQGRVFKRLIDLGWSESDIAKKSGINRAWVVELLNLQSAPEAVTGLVKSGQVAATLAIHTLKANKGDVEKTATDLNQAVETAKAAGKTRATAKHVGERKEKPPKPEKEPSLREKLVALLKDVEIREGKESGNTGLIFNQDQYDQFRVLLGL